MQLGVAIGSQVSYWSQRDDVGIIRKKKKLNQHFHSLFHFILTVTLGGGYFSFSFLVLECYLHSFIIENFESRDKEMKNHPEFLHSEITTLINLVHIF